MRADRQRRGQSRGMGRVLKMAIEQISSLKSFNSSQIELLKNQLSSTDYKVIKCYEYQLVNLPQPYDIQVLHIERQQLRDQIGALESEGGI